MRPKSSRRASQVPLNFHPSESGEGVNIQSGKVARAGKADKNIRLNSMGTEETESDVDDEGRPLTFEAALRIYHQKDNAP